MTTKPKARKFRIRQDGGAAKSETPATPVPADKPAARAPAGDANAAPQPQVSAEVSLDDIRKEGLTGRQLRMARRVAQKNGLAVTSDFDAVRQLRTMGVDPFQRNTILELVTPEGAKPVADNQSGKKPIGQIQLPQTVQHGQNLPSTEMATPADRRAGEIMQIQRDLAKRRRRKFALLLTRLSTFVFLPTILVGWYFYAMATPMYATNSEFVIQQAEASSAAGGLGGLFQGTSLATQQDSIAVQSYLASRAAMLRLSEDHGFKAHFSADNIDQIQRLAPDATNEAAFGVYTDKVKVSYDPTEGILRMEVIAADPETSQLYSEALIGYAEEQIDQLTQRPRDAAMEGARQNYDNADNQRQEALNNLLAIQEDTDIIDIPGTIGALTAQISALEQQRQQLELSLQERLEVRRPNQAQVDSLNSQISNITVLINDLRSQISTTSSTGGSLAKNTTLLRLAEEDYAFQVLQVQAALAQLEAAQIEANRQVRYLSLGVEPVAPDEATYPRAFENTVLAFLIFAGIYLMISLTASILREQVST
ncbi:capsular polysaccharide transport system permease protein [Loktanella ponticola]|uniref:Capsular polysaccharide transport system permease protein n=1 Tax=Yoonia ponticola TaxID=1524255 RepID=A0A7W9BMB6_9RHOB|nr:capsule biosynthesis protein [Yoonia ponticola]MBB5723193.1 capsular polysaccharide transport system permease protein [Yoonia ponticola]